MSTCCGIGVERGEGDALGEQDAGDDLADAAEAGDDDMAVVLGQGVEGLRHHRARRQALVDQQQQRRCRHRQRDGDRQQVGDGLVEHAGIDAGREQHEGELAALGDGERQAT